MAERVQALPTLIHDTRTEAGGDAAIAAAVAELARGGLVGLPTETVYGLAADATNPLAVAGIFAAKGRPRFNPLIIHVAGLAAAGDLATFGPAATRLGERFWPGPLTLVLPRREGAGIADLATAGLATVALRVPAHPVAQAVLRAFGRPLAAPSANRSGHVSPTTARHVADDLDGLVALILDAGPAAVGVESTIIGFTGDRPVLLRAGGIAVEDIKAVLGDQVERTAIRTGDAPMSPGMLASHYAPDVPLRLNAFEVLPDESLLAFGLPLPRGGENAVAVEQLSATGDLREAAARLFGALRELERRGAPIAAMPVPERDLGVAINDRLRRAAAPRS